MDRNQQDDFLIFAEDEQESIAEFHRRKMYLFGVLQVMQADAIADQRVILPVGNFDFEALDLSILCMSN